VSKNLPFCFNKKCNFYLEYVHPNCCGLVYTGTGHWKQICNPGEFVDYESDCLAHRFSYRTSDGNDLWFCYTCHTAIQTILNALFRDKPLPKLKFEVKSKEKEKPIRLLRFGKSFSSQDPVFDQNDAGVGYAGPKMITDPSGTSYVRNAIKNTVDRRTVAILEDWRHIGYI